MIGDSVRFQCTAHSPATVTLRVSGTLDRAGIAALRTELAGWRQAGVDQLRLDLSGVSTAGPGLARALTWAATQYRGRGQNLVVTRASEALRAQLATAWRHLQAMPGTHHDWPAALIYRPEPADQS